MCFCGLHRMGEAHTLAEIAGYSSAVMCMSAKQAPTGKDLINRVPQACQRH